MLPYAKNRRMLPVMLGVALGTLFILLTLRPQYLHSTTSYVQRLASSARASHHNSPQEIPLQQKPKKQEQHHHQQQQQQQPHASTTLSNTIDTTSSPAPISAVPTSPSSNNNTYHLVKSISGPDGAYLDIDFRGRKGYNPSIIPHGNLKDKWIAVAMQHQFWGEAIHSAVKMQMVCLASWIDGRIVCDDPPTSIATAPTMSGNCDVPDSQMAGMVALSVGGHDPRVFYGVDAPYITYGSLSNYDDTVCLGQWIQDFRVLVEWGPFIGPWIDYGIGQEIARPPRTNVIEKNYFVFWDPEGQMYAHYDFTPHRSFARIIDAHGSVGGLDLGNIEHLQDESLTQKNNLTSSDVEKYISSAESDAKCWARWLDGAPLHISSHVHQATNSLSVTLCSPEDPSRKEENGVEQCDVTDENTFIMHIFHAKTFDDKVNNGQQLYEAYVVLMKRSAPFGIHAIGRVPLRFVEPKKEEEKEEEKRSAQSSGVSINNNNGNDYKSRRNHPRQMFSSEKQGKRTALLRRDDDSKESKKEKTRELLYVTSMNWKLKDKNYHGFGDDVIFIGFGRDDKYNSMVDVTARELVGDMMVC